MVIVKFRKESGAKEPCYAYKGDAGLDIFSNEDIILEPMHRVAIKTGIYPEIPKGYAGLIWSKSGLALRQGLNMIAGIIDPNYRGELKVAMINLSSKPIKIEKGMKIAQLLVQKVENVKLKETKEVSKSIRGAKGFGSSGTGIEDIKKEISSRF